MAISITDLKNIADNTIILEISGEIRYINERKQGQYGSKQSIKLIDSTGEIYATFLKWPPLAESWKGQHVTLKSKMTAAGPKGIKKRSYQKDGETVTVLDIDTNTMTFFGQQTDTQQAEQQPAQQQQEQQRAPAQPQQGRVIKPIPEDELEQYLHRWFTVYNKVFVFNQTVAHPLPPESIGALTTHMVMNFIR